MRIGYVVPVIVALIALPSSTLPLGKKKPPENFQTHFSAEDGSVQKPVEIPADVLAVLRADKLVTDLLKHSDPPQPFNEAPSSWFSVANVHLRDSSEDDLVVSAEGPLAGANVTTFWVFAATQGGHKLVLNAPAHDLEITFRNWEGYREIELSGESAVVFTRVRFRWAGDRYVQAKSESHVIR